MIRVRDVKGDITRENEDDSFIELCNSDGKLIAVFYENQGNGEITQLMHDGGESARQYEKMFDVQFLPKRITLPK